MKKVWMVALVVLLVSPMLVIAAGSKKVQIEGKIAAIEDAANQQQKADNYQGYAHRCGHDQECQQ